jgi:hypothetical protein
VKITNADRSALSNSQPRGAQQIHDLGNVDVTVSVEVPNETLLPVGRRSEVYDEHPATRLDDAANLARAFDSRLARQMMEHQCAQDDVEVPVREGQSLDHGFAELDVRAGSFRLPRGAGDHFRRGVDTAHIATLTDPFFGGDRERAGSAPHVQYGLTWSQGRETHEAVPKRPLAAKQK